MARKKFNGGSRLIRKGPVRDLAKERRWRKCVARWQHSGLGVRAFCQREKLEEASFYHWRRELTQRSKHRPGGTKALSAAPRFVPVRVKPGSQSIPATASGITLYAENGIMLRLEREFDALTLGRVLAVLGGSSC